MRAPLFLLTTTAIALAAATAACFNWDDLLGRCQDAGNCLPPDGADSGDGGDGGDGGGDKGDAGQDGGGDGGDGGAQGGRRGANCMSPSSCVTGACDGLFCVCRSGGGCLDDSDCCLGQHCSSIPPAVGTCLSDTALVCGGPTTPCTMPGGCCSTCNGGNMCDCSPNTGRCMAKADCCDPNADCSMLNHCCKAPNMPCTMDDDCCSRVCRGVCH